MVVNVADDEVRIHSINPHDRSIRDDDLIIDSIHFPLVYVF